MPKSRKSEATVRAVWSCSREGGTMIRRNKYGIVADGNASVNR